MSIVGVPVSPFTPEDINILLMALFELRVYKSHLSAMPYDLESINPTAEVEGELTGLIARLGHDPEQVESKDFEENYQGIGYEDDEDGDDEFWSSFALARPESSTEQPE